MPICTQLELSKVFPSCKQIVVLRFLPSPRDYIGMPKGCCFEGKGYLKHFDYMRRNCSHRCAGSGMAQWLYVAVTQVPERRFGFQKVNGFSSRTSHLSENSDHGSYDGTERRKRLN